MGGLRAVSLLCREEAWRGFAPVPELAAGERTTPGASFSQRGNHGLALSIALHLFLLGSGLLLSQMTPAFSPPAGDREEIPVAILVTGEPEAGAASAPPSAIPVPEPVRANPEPVPKPLPAAKTKPAMVRKPTSSMERPSPVAEAGNRVVAASEADGVSATPPQGASSPSPPVAAGVPDADMDALIRRYTLTVWERIAAQKPDRIRLRGTVTLRFLLSRDGGLVEAGIAQSSGREDLDLLALDALRAAAPFPAPPSGMRDLSFTVPFRFR